MAVDTAVSPVRASRSNQFPYEVFMEGEGVPVHNAVVGVDDVTKLPREPWARTGGKGTFIELVGTFESERGIYVAEIPGGGALEPEHHLYEEEIFVLEGRGTAQVWQGNGEKMTFEWGTGSVFAFPPNTSHRLLNGAREPAVFLAVTSAPRIINALDNLDAVFNSDIRLAELDVVVVGDGWMQVDLSDLVDIAKGASNRVGHLFDGAVILHELQGFVRGHSGEHVGDRVEQPCHRNEADERDEEQQRGKEREEKIVREFRRQA